MPPKEEWRELFHRKWERPGVWDDGTNLCVPTKLGRNYYDVADKGRVEAFIEKILDDRDKKAGERFVTLLNVALNNVKLPEAVWKRIASVNAAVLHSAEEGVIPKSLDN